MHDLMCHSQFIRISWIVLLLQGIALMWDSINMLKSLIGMLFKKLQVIKQSVSFQGVRKLLLQTGRISINNMKKLRMRKPWWNPSYSVKNTCCLLQEKRDFRLINLAVMEIFLRNFQYINFFLCKT